MPRNSNALNRRGAMKVIGAAGAAALGAVAQRTANAATCLLTPAETEGPCFVEENLNRSDIRTDPSTGAVSSGVPLTLKIAVNEVTNSGCGPLANARIEIWHCDAGGVYSDEAQNNSKGRKF